MTRLALIIAAFAALALSFAAMASPVRGTHVAPIFVAGNNTCAQINVVYDHEFKIEPVTSGLKDDPASDFEVTLTVNNTAAGPTVDWVSNLPVDAVFVKGGDDGNLYLYAGGATSDTGLHAPLNPSGLWAGLSHLSFCFNDVPEATPTPTPTPTPEGSQAASSTPTPTPEGSQAGGTGTPAPSVPNTALSLTGSGSLATIFFGAVLIASLGALAYANVTAVRRRR